MSISSVQITSTAASSSLSRTQLYSPITAPCWKSPTIAGAKLFLSKTSSTGLTGDPKATCPGKHWTECGTFTFRLCRIWKLVLRAYTRSSGTRNTKTCSHIWRRINGRCLGTSRKGIERWGSRRLNTRAERDTDHDQMTLIHTYGKSRYPR